MFFFFNTFSFYIYVYIVIDFAPFPVNTLEILLANLSRVRSPPLLIRAVFRVCTGYIQLRE